jgi:hypothetical protein
MCDFRNKFRVRESCELWAATRSRERLVSSVAAYGLGREDVSFL